MPLSVIGRKYIAAEAKLEGNFLESKLPLRAFATLTLPHNASIMKLDATFSRWIEHVQAHNRLTVGWIKAYEHRPKRHIHAALVAGAPLDCPHAASIWADLIAPNFKMAAEVEPYRRGILGLGYILKTLGSPTEETQFSRNLSAFAHDSGTRFFGRTSAERRQVRHIRNQKACKVSAAQTSVDHPIA